MFRKRAPINRKNAPAEVPHQSDHSTGLDHNPLPKSDDNEPSRTLEEDSSSLLQDSNVSFRRGLRDGTITNRVHLSHDKAHNPTKKRISNLSFTDSLVENDLQNIHLRASSRNRKTGKKRSRKGIDLSSQQKSTKVPAEEAKRTELSPPMETDAQMETDEHLEDVEQLSESPEPSEHDYDEDVGADFQPEPEEEDESDDSHLPQYEISDDEGEIDMDKEISQIIKNSEDELEILKRNLKSTEDSLSRASEKIAQLKEDELELSNELSLYHALTETSRTLVSLVEVKLPELSAALERIKTSRIDETEYLLRMRRWLRCDLVRPFSVPNLDYWCGELEDIDEMGKDLSIAVSRTFEKRVQALEAIKDDFLEKSLQRAKKLKADSLEAYLSPEVRDLFTLKLGDNYTLSQLTELYEYEHAPEKANLNLMDDVNEEYASISTALQPFRRFRDTSDRYGTFEFAKNLKDIFVFYAKLSILTWNPLENPSPEGLEWFSVAMEFDRSLLSVIVDEVLFLLALNCIEYFDIESWEQCRNLSEFLAFVLRNSSQISKSGNVEKITSELLKSLQTKISVVTFKLSSKDSPLTSLISDPVALHILKFTYLRLASNLLCFADILANQTLATLVVDDLFVGKLLPLLIFESPLDAFVVLNFKALCAPLNRHFQIKTKNNAIVKLTYRRFCESEWATSDSELFNALSVPLHRDEYSRLIES